MSAFCRLCSFRCSAKRSGCCSFPLALSARWHNHKGCKRAVAVFQLRTHMFDWNWPKKIRLVCLPWIFCDGGDCAIARLVLVVSSMTWCVYSFKNYVTISEKNSSGNEIRIDKKIQNWRLARCVSNKQPATNTNERVKCKEKKSNVSCFYEQTNHTHTHKHSFSYSIISVRPFDCFQFFIETVRIRGSGRERERKDEIKARGERERKRATVWALQKYKSVESFH